MRGRPVLWLPGAYRSCGFVTVLYAGFPITVWSQLTTGPMLVCQFECLLGFFLDFGLTIFASLGLFGAGRQGRIRARSQQLSYELWDGSCTLAVWYIGRRYSNECGYLDRHRYQLGRCSHQRTTHAKTGFWALEKKAADEQVPLAG